MVTRQSLCAALLIICFVARAGAQGAAPPAPVLADTPPAAGEGAPAAAPKKLDKAALIDAKRAYSAGELSYQAGDYKSAILNFRDAQAHVPSPHASYWLAMSLKADGQIPAAIAERIAPHAL